VFFGAPKGEAKTILVTSPAAVDGKTTLVSNLAIAMAQAGQKTLILDADFRKPMQHKIFEANHHDSGFSSVLAGTTTLEETIQPTEVKGLELLPCGLDVPNPSEILNSESFAKLLELLSNKYDRVIIDSPPVMLVTDAQILGAICDITLLVLRAEKSTRKNSQQARDGLLSIGAHLLGVVVNDVPRKSRYGYYYGGYGYHYGYYGDGHRKKNKASDRKPAVVMEGPNSFASAKD
jgi:capsular exopolysaccharide synthesis family protein